MNLSTHKGQKLEFSTKKPFENEPMHNVMETRKQQKYPHQKDVRHTTQGKVGQKPTLHALRRTDVTGHHLEVALQTFRNHDQFLDAEPVPHILRSI